MNTKIIKFDINKNLYNTLIAKQGDTKSRFLLFNLLDGSIPFSLENRSVRVYAVKPDRTEVFNDLIITDAAKGYCILELTTQMLAVAGTVKLELMVIEEDKKLTSNIFYMDVKESINSEKAVVSTNEFGALLTALSSLNEYDNYKREIAAARDGEANLLTKVKKIDEQLDNIETYVTPEMFKLNVELDDTNAIKKAIETGRDVELNGDYTISSKIVLNTRFQKFIQRKGFIYPTDFEDNCIEILSADNIVLVRIKGDKQTKNSNSSAIVIGDTLGVNHGANLCLDNTFIEGYKGNGIKHINGSMVSYKNVYVNGCDGHGIYLTAEAEDNHHASFINTHVVNCTGYGYYFEVSNVSDDTTNSPGVAVFENAKAYGNLENFHIETSGHYGTIFSEAGKSPDKFTETSRALSLVYLGDIVSSNNFIDSGNGNQITGTNTFKQRTDRKRYVEKIIYTTNKAGSREVSQSDNNEFLDIITDTYNEVTVKHERGSSSSRTDTFDKIKIGDCFMRCIANQKISISEAISIESGGYYKLDTNISVSASVNSIIKPFVQMNKNDDLIVSIVANRTDSGWYHPYITLFNPTNRIISLSSGTTFDFVAFS